MALTGVEICANALVRLGAQPIQSFDEGTDIATYCNTIYPTKRAFILGKFNWRFSGKFVQLSRLTATPTMQWSYQFALPSDMIQGGFVAIFTDDAVGQVPIRDYSIIGNYLMCDSDTLYAHYQYDVDESNWPAYFTELMVNVMKSELCLLITDNQGLDQQIRQETYGTPTEYPDGGMIRQAMFLDSRDNPSSAITDFTLINARFGSV